MREQKIEFDEAHIFGSTSSPANDFPQSMRLLPQDKKEILIVYCNDTKSRVCQKWAKKARAAGYLNIVLYGEFLAWKENDLPIAPLNVPNE